MWPLLTQVNLLRYLIVWRGNGSQIQLPRCLPVEISQALAALIAERLPSQQAKPWRKGVAEWGTLPGESDAAGVGAGLRPPPAPTTPAPTSTPTVWPAWPIECVIWPYPGKRAYGQGEPLLWELKLLGAAADHGLFLEMILPAMEAAAMTADERWRRPRSLWGRFDIQAIYAARGSRWEPFVTDGRLDLAYRPTPSQWAEGFTFETDGKRRYHRLNWLTPFDLEASGPDLRAVMDALMARIAPLTLGKWATAEQAWGTLAAEEQQSLWLDCETSRLKRAMLERAPRDGPGRWIGAQLFATIPPRLLPYLDLAAILHVGKHTHFGCGTFAVE